MNARNSALNNTLKLGYSSNILNLFFIFIYARSILYARLTRILITINSVIIVKNIYIKIFLVFYLSLTIFTIVGAISVAAFEPEVDEADYLATAVTPGGNGGYQHQCQYCGSNGDGYAHTHTHQNNGDYDHNQYSWAWDCKEYSCICDCLCGNQYYC